MTTHPGPAGPPAVLVVTVWFDAGGTRLMVSHTEPAGGRHEAPPVLHRQPAGSDAAVLELVRDWLGAVDDARAMAPAQPITMLPHRHLVERGDAT